MGNKLATLVYSTVDSGLTYTWTTFSVKIYRDVNEARKSEAKDEAQAQKNISGPRPGTSENNSVCMSMETKILAFRT